MSEISLFEAINNRRSIRKYKPDPVPDEILRKLVKAGSMAPTASNLQAWRFCLITDKDLVRKVDMFSPGLSGKPPVIMAVCSDYHYAEEKGGKNSRVYGCIMDASMAAENVMLEAQALGLGTCAIKSYNDAAVRKLLKLPEKIVIELLISIGYPEDNSYISVPLRKGFDEILFYNQWGEKDE